MVLSESVAPIQRSRTACRSPLPWGANNRFFWVDGRVFPTVVDWRTNASKDGMPAEGTYSLEAVRALDTHRTPIQKQPEMILCLVGISRRYYLGDEVTNCCPLTTDMDLFNLIRAPNPTNVKTRSRPRAPHEVPLLTLTASRVIEKDDPAATTDSSGVPSTIERSPLDFSLEAGASAQGTVALEMPPSEDLPVTDVPEAGQAEETAATDPPAALESRKRGRDGTDVNAPPKSLRDHADPRPSRSSREGKSLIAIQLGLAATVFVPEDVPAGVSDPDPLSVADPPSCHPADVAQSSQGTAAARDPESKNASSPVEVGSPESIYRPEWGLCHLHNDEVLRRYNVNLAQQVAMGSQLRLRFEQEAKLLRKSVAQVARRDKRIQARELEIKNLELRQAFADAVSAGIAKVLSEGLRHGLKHGQAQLSLESIEAYDPEAEAKFVAALQALKDLKYPLVDVIIAAMYLESDTKDDAPQDIRDLRLSSSHLTIHVYPEVRDPRNSWACKEEIVLADAITANISRAEKKKKCRIVCRTHGVGSAHHARSDGVPISAPTVVP
nr:hypothetical protein [Tanacetum cinerariifolium]